MSEGQPHAGPAGRDLAGAIHATAGEGARIILEVLMRSGEEARLIGGCVRDAILGLQPGDIDIATPLLPEEVMRRLKQEGIRTIPTGIDHGTITAVVGRASYEITTLRRDVETDGRHAKVMFCQDWLEDAQRRDFTINALSLTPEGELFDPFGGLADLRAGRVRFIGNARERIGEDVLRILRFFRFHGRFGKGPPDRDSFTACATLAPLLPGLSGERIAKELLAILRLDRAVEIWRLMLEAGVVAQTLPTATRLKRLEALDRLEWVLGEAGAMAHLAALLPPGPVGAADTAERLRLSNNQRNQLLALCAPTVDVHPDLTVTSRRHALQKLGPELYRDLLLLAAADRGTAAQELLEPLAEAATWVIIPFPLKGRDLLEQGVPPGPDLGILLAGLEGWWAARDYRPDREECLAELARRLSLRNNAEEMGNG
ncbi:CCA tRNA nucleotidyltransferase [Niveispirillum sp. SYP-B3756]|uniref:CCA tRNA nucleotidyltransferase n=1 Tax=Niveispirillum sp. SYP-B3756 TaxID=2662178 RepID=UPI0012917A7A|nr:CCA tRNA nucleotidyltransferase [Niveispirillum sp. SYP-B3756]MQP64190.1 CCA tRNA nucleotidyltransferase [Niveispirillum sp. SYP-B3756]